MADYSQIIQEINNNIPDNDEQIITAEKVRTTLEDITTFTQDGFDTIENEKFTKFRMRLIPNKGIRYQDDFNAEIYDDETRDLLEITVPTGSLFNFYDYNEFSNIYTGIFENSVNEDSTNPQYKEIYNNYYSIGESTLANYKTIKYTIKNQEQESEEWHWSDDGELYIESDNTSYILLSEVRNEDIEEGEYRWYVPSIWLNDELIIDSSEYEDTNYKTNEPTIFDVEIELPKEEQEKRMFNRVFNLLSERYEYSGLKNICVSFADNFGINITPGMNYITAGGGKWVGNTSNYSLICCTLNPYDTINIEIENNIGTYWYGVSSNYPYVNGTPINPNFLLPASQMYENSNYDYMNYPPTRFSNETTFSFSFTNTSANDVYFWYTTSRNTPAYPTSLVFNGNDAIIPNTLALTNGFTRQGLRYTTNKQEFIYNELSKMSEIIASIYRNL